MSDVQINDQGSVVVFIFNSQSAKEWANENLQTEHWQWFGSNALAVDHRFADPIITFLQDDGFSVK